MDHDELKLPQERPPQSTIEMLEKFNPEGSRNDHRILYEILRRKLDD